ncbi:MAG: S-layer homology domain-containing protein, partial [Clostridia bacterium]|nr:S-layer homology domain-containing protein [Clostridia bacterium]
MNFKKILSTLLAVMMLLSVFTVSLSAEDEFPFTDVTVGGWSYEGIKFAYENGLMNGTGGSCFSPGVDVTRGMVVTVLYRLEGSPRMKFKELFLDIEERLYYTEAVLWAKEQGIVTATSTNEWGEEYFTPDRSITRQELATMFVRYAKYKNINTANTATLDRFTDKDSVATWAADAMKWATSVGLINGTGNGDTLSPTMTATREQFATIMHRFDTIEFDYDLNYAEAQEISKYTEPDYPLVNDADVYVAVDGHDSNPGTLEKPLATFDAARLKVRELKKTAKDEIVVAFKAGNYGYLENVTFTEEDGGSETVPIKYCKYGDGDVIFQNGIVIKENEFTLVDESEKSMFPKDSRDHIYKVDLTGRLDKFEFKTRIFGETGYPTEAREPNNSYYSNMTTTVDDHASIQLQLALPGIVEKLRSVDGMKVSGYLRAGYIFDYFPVKSYDAETDILVFDFENYEFDPVSGFTLDEYPLMYEGRTDDLVYFSNLPEFIDLPGEYWFDNSTSTLYIYYARGDYAIDAGGTYVTVNKGAEYLSFVGLEFNGSSE